MFYILRPTKPWGNRDKLIPQCKTVDRRIRMNTVKRQYKKRFITISSTLLLMVLAQASHAGTQAAPVNNPTLLNVHSIENQSPHEGQTKIQIAILLDTSSSMDGLIDQARNQIWQAVNEFSKARKNGVSPTLEVAVYEYGNDNLSPQSGYTRQVTGFTTELDRVSEALFSLTTHGGSEYCGYAISDALKHLQWTQSTQDIKAVFIAGNEPFTQGPISYKKSIDLANTKGIVVNTIHAGNYDEGVQGGWKDGALSANGNYMSIDHNHQVVHIATPHDQKLAELNQQLNQTYIPYGRLGIQSKRRQEQQDQLSNAVSPALLAQRTKSKTSSMYRNNTWDLVDAIETGTTDLDDLKNEALPEEMQSLSESEKKLFIAEKQLQRKTVQKEITELSKKRNAFILQAKKELNTPQVNTLREALTKAVHEQGTQKQFVFENP